MKRAQLIPSLFALILIALILSPASAKADSIQYSLNLSGCSGGCTVPAGTVTLTQDGSSVDVLVNLNSASFIDTGSSHTSFVFDINGAPKINVTSLSAGFSWPADSLADTPFGAFDYGIDCIATGTPSLPPGTPTCGPGASNVVPPPLQFTVSLASGSLSIYDFGGHAYSPDGPGANVFFAADIYDNLTGNTGAVGAVPEASSFALLGCGLAGIAAFRRRLQKTRVMRTDLPAIS